MSYETRIFLPDGEVVETTAKKTKYGWEVGGDVACVWTDIGATVMVKLDKGIHQLKGCRMVFQDTDW